MSTLNPDLISKDMDAVLNDAVPMLKEYRKSSIMPEMVLLSLLRRENTAAWRMLKMFETSRGVDLERLERQVKVAAQSRRDPDGSLDFVAIGNRKVSLSRQSIVLLDDGLTIANSMNEQKIDTDHALAVLAETSVSTGGILRQFSITPKAIQDAYSDASKIIPAREDSTTVDFVKRAKRGLLRAVHFREDLLRNMINVLTQSVNRHIVLVGPDGVGKRTLAYSLALLMAEEKGAGRSVKSSADQRDGAVGWRPGGLPRGHERGTARRLVLALDSPFLWRTDQGGLQQSDFAGAEGVSK